MASVLTLFPEMFPGPLGHSLAGRALQEGRWRLETIDLRDFATDRHRTVDDVPFGGGAGMVMRPDVVARAIDAARARGPERPAVFLTPRGRPLTQRRVAALAAGPGVVILCGRFEGVDQRVIEARGLEELSLGDIVLSGGEPAAIALIDACVRLLPGRGRGAGVAERGELRAATCWSTPTTPGRRSGRGARCRRCWSPAITRASAPGAQEQAERITRCRRPDLWARHLQSVAEQSRGLVRCRPDKERGSAMNVLQELEQEQIAARTKERPIPDFAPATRCASTSRSWRARASGSRRSRACASRARTAASTRASPCARSATARAWSAIFPLYSPQIASIEVVRRGRVRRAKLYYLRGRTGKAARIQEKRDERARTAKARPTRPSRRTTPEAAE